MLDLESSNAACGGALAARRVGFALARYRERYRVALDALAEWSGIPVDRLITFEGGRAVPAREELERVVNAFARVGEGPPVDVRAMRAELLRLGGYPQPWARPRRSAPALVDA